MMRSMKPVLRAAALFAALSHVPCACRAEIGKGLSFRSYEVSPSCRTSLSIPAEEGGAVRFGDYFAVSFDLKIDTERESFGYVCRLIVDDAHSVDLILSNPVNGVPYLGINTASGGFEPLRLHAGLGDWNRIDLVVAAQKEGLAVSANGERIATFDDKQSKHTAAVLFGWNVRGIFTTSDVAPSTIRNLTLSLRPTGAPDYRWELGPDDNLADNGPSGLIAIRIENPEWLIERHSRWRKIQDFAFGSKVFPVIDPYGMQICFVSADKVTLFRPRERKTEEYPFTQNIRVDLITNDFIMLPGGRLIYYDFENERPIVDEFDFAARRWQRSVGRTAHSKYLHHNKLFNPVDSCVVQLFGYGFHRYLDEAVRWRAGSDSVIRFSLDSIGPRYLSAVGMADTVAYIYGGKGNDRGIQEFGTRFYNDLYRLDLRDYSVRKLWEGSGSDLQVAASNLVIADDGKRFSALFYSPDSDRSYLQMREYTIADGRSRLAGDSIPYDFIDVSSDAGLLFDSVSKIYYAVVANKNPDSGYRASVYTIRYPVLAPTEPRVAADRSAHYYLLPVALLAVVGIAAALFRMKRGREKVLPMPEELAAEPVVRKAPGIYLLGGFRVIDSEGKEITSNFTPVMRQLLVLIILYTDKQHGRGISSAELKEALWSDKSEESYYNNRGVNIRKIRMLLSEVGAVEIAAEGGYWHLAGDVSLCDYIRHIRYLASVDSSAVSEEVIEMLIGMAHYGTLLPDMQFEWTDRFKADYADRFILLLSRIRDNGSAAFSPQTRIRLADAILAFDSLDEDAVRVKCRALIRLKRHGIAKNVFNAFTQEYERLMGEKYRQRFDGFVRDADSAE